MAAASARRSAVAIVLALACVGMVAWVSMLEESAVKESALDRAMADINKAFAPAPKKKAAAKPTQVDKVGGAMAQISTLLETGQGELPSYHDYATSTDKVHDNIVGLKAYCVAAKDAIHDQGDGTTSSVIPFIIAFGEHPKETNVIVEYSKLFAKFSNEFDNGMGLYILQHMNSAILHGGGAVNSNFVVGSAHLTLDPTQMGLESIPRYLEDLKVSRANWSIAKTKIADLNKNADAMAAAQYLKGKHNEFYISFLDAEIAKADAIRRGTYAGVVKHAFDAEEAAFHEAVGNASMNSLAHVGVQAPAGRTAADSAAEQVAYVEPTMEELEAAAKAAARQFMGQIKSSMDSTANLVTIEEKEAMGVTLHISTASLSEGESGMKPSVHIKGTKASITGQLMTLPQPDETIHQTFPSDEAIGDLVSVTFTAEGSDPWLCSEVSAQIGTSGLPTVLKAKTGSAQSMFWLETDGTHEGEHQGIAHGGSWELLPEGVEATSDFVDEPIS